MLTLHTQCCVSDLYVRFSGEYTHMHYRGNYLHHDVYQITMSDLMMNVHTCVTDDTIIHHVLCQTTLSELTMNAHTYATDDTTFIMMYVRSICQI
jgi:hypothetical protein